MPLPFLHPGSFKGCSTTVVIVMHIHGLCRPVTMTEITIKHNKHRFLWIMPENLTECSKEKVKNQETWERKYKGKSRQTQVENMGFSSWLMAKTIRSLPVFISPVPFITLWNLSLLGLTPWNWKWPCLLGLLPAHAVQAWPCYSEHKTRRQMCYRGDALCQLQGNEGEAVLAPCLASPKECLAAGRCWHKSFPCPQHPQGFLMWLQCLHPLPSLLHRWPPVMPVSHGR